MTLSFTAPRRFDRRTEEIDMANVDAQFATLKKQFKETEDDINAKTQAKEELVRTQRKTESELQRLTARKNTLQETIAYIDAKRLAINKERQTAKDQEQDATSAVDTLRARLEKQLTQEHRDDIKNAVTLVNDDIARQKKRVDELSKQVDRAEKANAAAKDAVTKFEAKHQEAQKELGELPAKITAARGAVAKLKVDMMNAAQDTGRVWEVYSLERDFNQAITTLRELIDHDREGDLIDTLLKRPDELKTLNEKVDKAAEELASLREQLEPAKQDLQRKEQGRGKAIEEKISPDPKITRA
jgi:chromosome segregation ATPase